MRRGLLAAGVLVFAAGSVLAAPGETWILPIHHLDGGGWTELPGAGYGGSSAWQGSGADGVRRVYWELSGIGSLGHEPDPNVKTYTIEFYVPTQGAGDWQPIESQLNGVNGEAWPMEPGIPWVGAWGTNHQYIGSEFTAANAGTWKGTGPGPHTPESDDYNAGPNGDRMWLKKGSWLYAKWDFPWPITRSWSALRVTETPEPASMLLLALGGAALLRRKPIA